MSRTYAIINYYGEDRNIFENILDKMQRNGEDTYYVFYKEMPKFDATKYADIKFVKIDNSVVDSRSATKNFVLKYIFENVKTGFVHLMEDSIQFIGDIDTQTTFNNEIEKFISIFNLGVWLNTTTDECNYVFEKYNPRFTIKIDNESYSNRYSNDIIWTSHANTSYVIYNLDKITYDEVKFDDRFKVPMFYILEFLARRRSQNKGFMNMYPTIMAERGVFSKIKNIKVDHSAFKNFSTEEILFKSLELNMQPTVNVDEIFEFIKTNLD